jgi:hypothetical protein
MQGSKIGVLPLDVVEAEIASKMKLLPKQQRELKSNSVDSKTQSDVYKQTLESLFNHLGYPSEETMQSILRLMYQAKVCDQLRSELRDLAVIPVLGTGGAGKTSLVVNQRPLNRSEVVNRPTALTLPLVVSCDLRSVVTEEEERITYVDCPTCIFPSKGWKPSMQQIVHANLGVALLPVSAAAVIVIKMIVSDSVCTGILSSKLSFTLVSSAGPHGCSRICRRFTTSNPTELVEASLHSRRLVHEAPPAGVPHPF